MIDVLWLAGTGYGKGGDGVSEAFRLALLADGADRFTFRYVDYPGDYGLGMSYEESVAAGRANLVAALHAAVDPVIIGGYSQGAAVAGDIAARGPYFGTNVRGVVLIADPLRPEGATADRVMLPAPAGYGASGMRPINNDLPVDPNNIPVFWIANAGDPITALPRGNPLRSLADITDYMAATVDPVRAQDLLLKTISAVASGRMQRWWSWSNWRDWGGALAYMRGYVLDGRHTTDYVTRGLCAAAAACVLNHSFE
jgi:predicted esterase